MVIYSNKLHLICFNIIFASSIRSKLICERPIEAKLVRLSPLTYFSNSQMSDCHLLADEQTNTQILESVKNS